jgi:hypothetical protein
MQETPELTLSSFYSGQRKGIRDTIRVAPLRAGLLVWAQFKEEEMLNRPTIVVQVSTLVDSRMALAPNRTQWEEMDDPRSTASEGNSEAWAEMERLIAVMHKVQARMQGSNSFVKEDEVLKSLPAFEGHPEALYQDYLPDEIVQRPDLHTWLVVVDGRGRMRGGYTGADNE